MNRRLLKCVVAALFAWLALYGLEKLAQAQTTGTGGSTGGASSGGSLLSGGGMSGGSSLSGGASGSSSSQTLQGAGYSGGTTGTTTKSSGSSTSTIPAASNVFGPYYMNPMSRGLLTTTGTDAKGNFNTPLYATKTTTTSKSSASTRTSSKSNSNSSFSTHGLERSIPYVTGLSDDLPVVRPIASALQAELIDIIQRSSALKSKDKITVAIDGATVVLRGEVASAKEAGLVERMLSMEPGVREISNQLTVKANP